MKKPASHKPYPIRYAVVDAEEEIVSPLCRHEFHPEQLVRNYGEGQGYRVAKFYLVEIRN